VLLLVVKWLVLWFAYMLIFIAAGSAISIVAIEVDAGVGKTSGMAALGFWAVPTLFFWMLCIPAAVVVVIRDHSLSGILNALGIFLPGLCLGSAMVFMAGPLWGSRRRGQ
jgi:hypothetical protein